MYKNELIDYIQKDKFSRNVFCGVKSLDELTNIKIKRPCGFIVNTQLSTQRGEHWFSVFIPEYGPIEYFDSFGHKPQHSEVYNFIKANGGKYSSTGVTKSQ